MVKGKPKKSSPGQMAFPWAQWEAPGSEVHEKGCSSVSPICHKRSDKPNGIASLTALQTEIKFKLALSLPEMYKWGELVGIVKCAFSEEAVESLRNVYLNRREDPHYS